MKPSRRHYCAAAAAATLLAALPVRAQAYPSKPLKWIVPFPPGGPTDTFSRPVALALGEALGQPVVVENVPGAGASIGMERVARSAPDGYTIGLATTGTLAINPHLYGSRLPHDTSRDFTTMTLAARYVNVLVISPKLGISSIAELVAYAKANPGKVNFGSAGVGNTLHLATELFKLQTGVVIVDVPYKGASQAVVDLLAGNIQMMFDLVQTPLQHINAGKLRALGTTWEKRAGALPNVPTMIEQGFDYNFGAMIGIFGPAGMPRDVVTRLHAEISKVMLMPDVRESFAKQAMEPLTFATPEAYAAQFRKDVDEMGKLVRAAKIEPQ